MSEKKQTKNLELFEDENSNSLSRKDAKELNLNEKGETKSEVKPTNKKTNSDNSITKESKPKKDSVLEEAKDSKTETLFDEKKPKEKENSKGTNPKDTKHASSNLAEDDQKKAKQRRIIKIALIVFVVLAVITGIIVGSLAAAGVGVFGEKSGINIPGAGPGMGTWVEDHSEDQNKEEEILSIYEDRATLYAYDYLGANNLLFIEPNQVQSNKEKIIKDKQKEINTEKENLRDSEGKNWKEAWDKSLIDKGFATSDNGGEDQYLDSLVSAELQQDVVDAFTGNGYITGIIETVPAAEKDNYEFVSSEFTSGSTDYVYAIKNGTSTVAKNNVDIESLFEFYLDYSKPVSYQEVAVPMSVSNYDKTHTIDNNSIVTFATTDDLATFYDIFHQDNVNFKNFGEPTNTIVELNNFTIAASGGDEGEPTTPETASSSVQTRDGETDGSEGDGTVTTGGMTPQDAIFTTQLLVGSTINATGWDTLMTDINDSFAAQGITSSNDIKKLSDSELDEVGRAIGSDLKDNSDLITTGQSFNIKEFSTTSGSKLDAYKMTVALESDGMHFIKWNGFDPTSDSVLYDANNIDYALGKAYFKNDIDVTRNLKKGDEYGIFDSYKDWVGSNYQLLILNSAYEYGVNLNSNSDYPEWDDILAGSEITLTDLEESLYGNPFLEMFSNYANRKINYINYSDKYLGTDGSTDWTAFETNVKNTIYTPSDWLDASADDALKEWNYFRINLDKDVVPTPGKDDAYGAIKIFTKTKIKGGNK